MSENKDRMGEKMRNVERAREDQFAAERDRELLEKIRQKGEHHKHPGHAADAAAMHCPRCHRPLEAKTHGGVEIMACPIEEGAWLDSAALKHLLKHLPGSSR